MPSVDSRSGFCLEMKTFHSLRPPTSLPPESLPISAAAFSFSLLPSPLPSNPALIDSATGASISFTDLISQTRSLAAALAGGGLVYPGDVAFVVAPSRLDIPVLYLALLSLGVVVSPVNPASTASEIAHQISISNPSVAFATTAAASKIPSHVKTLILDFPSFRSLLSDPSPPSPPSPEIRQSHAAAILYSSGTTGRVKGVVITHRNFIALIAGSHVGREQLLKAAEEAGEPMAPGAGLFTIPLFHMYGFFMLLRAVAGGETTVLMERFEFGAMLSAVEKYSVTFMPAAPPLVVAMTKSGEVVDRDLSSLRIVRVGGAPLGRELAELFRAQFPRVEIVQAYGLTESAGIAEATIRSEESQVYGSVGRISSNLKAKIVDPTSGEALCPRQRGELWIRGPTIMKGYVGDDEATKSTLDSEGWLKTGDLCYFDEDGFLFIVDRLKELIKYKAYQVPPAELEHILQSHPEIADAAVIPYPDEEAGQIPMAFIVRKPNSILTDKQVMDFVAKQVAPYKKIRRVAFVSSIPKSAAGKILRRELINYATSMPASKL
ncbi:4-coumarate--CoA ligase-like 5 [Typha angustifolia]|uniref:4-coumarate--CoA ligase-like 5 n=1 Tax=Typha angustifolia TaxID=59011 RepID=UPI003C2D17D6